MLVDDQNLDFDALPIYLRELHTLVSRITFQYSRYIERT